jgi:hypothetical protein
MKLSYSEVKQVTISGLCEAAFAHESGRLQAIETSFDSLDANLPRDAGPEFDKLFIALNFWDGWIDARNHDWQYYEGIGAEDWPGLARRIIADIAADREITDGLILKHFDFRSRKDRRGILRRFAGILRRKG